VTRIAFLIKRKNHYRVLGALVEEALRRSWAVECWHDHGHARDGWKGHEFPDHVPAFQAGAPRVIAFQGTGELAERFEVDPPDAIVCVDPPDPEVVAVSKAPWFWLQFAADLVLTPDAPQGLRDATAVGMYSPWWTRRLRRNFGEELTSMYVRRKVAAVGMPMLDLAAGIDPDKVRWTYGLPRDRPLVLYLPYPTKSAMPRRWLRQVLGGWTRATHAINRRLGPPRADRRIVEALRGFCDRHGAALVVKERVKDPGMPYVRRAAAAMFDESQEAYHPPLILELLRCASLCVHYYSTAALEAVYCGVPSLCIAPEPHEMGLDRHNATLVHNGRPGGIYNWPGAAHWRPLAEAADGFGRWSLADFPLDPDARRRYVSEFLGPDDGRASVRFLDLVADRLA
jgi:hypothetical protein